MDRSPELVYTVLAVLRSGAAYLPGGPLTSLPLGNGLGEARVRRVGSRTRSQPGMAARGPVASCDAARARGRSVHPDPVLDRP